MHDVLRRLPTRRERSGGQDGAQCPVHTHDAVGRESTEQAAIFESRPGSPVKGKPAARRSLAGPRIDASGPLRCAVRLGGTEELLEFQAALCQR